MLIASKNMSGLKLALMIGVSILSGSAYADIKLPSVFGNGMVLQQRATVPIWGTSDGQAVAVTTSWNNQTYHAKVDEQGSWRIRVKTPKAGGPYQINLNDGSELVLGDVLIGEVWLASGQSNMNMRVAGSRKDPVLHSDTLIAEAGNQRIRLFRVPTGQSARPLDDCDASWSTPDSTSVAAFSAVAYQFALNLQRELDVPVGILQSAYGGTKVEAWMDSTALNGFPLLAGLPAPDKVTKNTPTALFNAMINPILGYGIRGVIWYQGEGNRSTADRYADWLAGMVRGWRYRWGQDEFPFYYVQIAPYKYDGTHQSAYLREAQLRATKLIPHSAMVVTLDVGLESTIHPPDKTTVANRLSNVALAETYKKKRGEVYGPTLKRMKVEGSVVRLQFDHVADGLTASRETLNHFEVAGADRIFYPAEAHITGKDKIVVSAKQVANPESVRYAFKDWVLGDLYNSAGLPASSFRTDEWEGSF